MRMSFRGPATGLFLIFAAGSAGAQFGVPVGYGSGGTISTLATPLPPGPGSVPFTMPGSPFAAPVMMPLGAPTAAPVGIYSYPSPAMPTSTSWCDTPSACPTRFWASAEFLYGASSGVHVPALVTAAPSGTPLPQAGALTSPSTVVVFGDDRDLNTFRPGFRLNVGFWCDDTTGLDAGYFFLGRQSEGVSATSAPGGVILARPVVLAGTGASTALPVAGADLAGLPLIGGITSGVTTSVIGADVNYRRALQCGGCSRVDLLAGYRYLHLGDTADVWTAGTIPAVTGVDFAPGQTFLTHDSLRTRNNFHGPQLGLVGSWQLGGVSLELLTKLAMGVTVAAANTEGVTTVLPAGTTVATGLLVGPTNSVAATRGSFAVIPEAGVKLGYGCSDRIRLTAGYSFLYWSSVRRAAEQIDLTIGGAAPTFRDVSTGVWVQGLTAGIEVRY